MTNRPPLLSIASGASSTKTRSDWILGCLRMVTSAYRKDDFHDAEAWTLQAAMILERYSDAIITEASDPVTGIQSHCKFPPSLAELKEYLTDASERAERIARYKIMGPARKAERVPAGPGDLANLLVRKDRPRYAAMMELAKKPGADPRCFRIVPEGIWVALGWYDR
jgi:hypothetical protein